MFDRLLTPFVALGLALLVWMYTRSRDQEVIDNYPVTVEFQKAAGQAELFDLEVNGPNQVPVSFSGPPSRIRELRNMLQQGRVRISRTVTVPETRLADARHTDSIRLEAAEVPVPGGIKVVIPENQSRINVTLRRIIEKRLPVRFQHTGGDQIEKVAIEPPTVLVRGHKEILEREESISTQLFTVPSASAATEPVVSEKPEAVELIHEMDGRPMRVSPATVSVRYTLKPRQKLHELADVPIHFLCPANFTLRPQFTSERLGKISLKVMGPALDERPAVSAYVDLTARKFGPGLHAEEPIRVQLPTGFQLAQEPPRLASFQLVPADTAAKPTEAAFPP